MLFLCQVLFWVSGPGEVPGLIYVLDASGSMWGQLGGRAKIEWARDAVIQSLEKLPKDQPFALYVYGHRQASDCNDIELQVPLGPLDLEEVKTKLTALKPKGKTPLHNALKTCFTALSQSGQSATVVLISDGLETCDGDACSITIEAHQTGRVLVHVVGFDLPQEEPGVSALECIAQAGGGTYFDATNGDQLGQALDMANRADINHPGGQLVVEARNNGQLMDVAVQVFDGDCQITSARTYQNEQTNPRTLRLDPGTYRVQITPIGHRGAKAQVFDQVEITINQPRNLSVDFSSGKVRVKTDTNGNPTDCTVILLEPGGRKAVVSRRTYRNSEPVVLEVPPGLYDLEVKSLIIEGASLIEEKSIRVEAGQVIDRAFSIDSGLCEVRTRFGTELVDCIVALLPPDGKKPIAQARSYAHEKSNPVKFIVPPGEYTVKVTPIDRKRFAIESHDLTVTKGERVSWDCVLTGSGL